MKTTLGLGFGQPQSTGKLFADHEWLMNEADISPLITLDNLRRTSYRGNPTAAAQTIRDSAGIPSGIDVGLQTGESAGLSDAGALGSTQTGILDIDNETEAAAEAVSGDGTESTPYLIQNRDVDVGAGVAQSVRIQGDYYITFDNCRFSGGNARTFIALSWTGTARFTNCEFYNDQTTASIFDLNTGSGDFIFENCLFSGCLDGSGIVITNANSISLTNCQVDASQQNWADIDSFLICNNSSCIVTAQYIQADVSASATVPYCLFRMDAGGDGCSFENVYAKGWKKIVTDINTAGSTTSNLYKKDNMIIRYVHGDDLHQEHIELIYTDNLLIEHCYFTHINNGNTFRMILLTADFSTQGIYNEGTTIRYCRFDSQNPDDVANNEIITYDIGRNIHIHHCWCENAPEDYIEPRFPTGPQNIHDIVGDNTVGAVVNAWQAFEFDTWAQVDTNEPASSGDDSGLYVRRIYGDAGRHGVAMEGTKDGVIHDIYVTDNDLSPTVTTYSVQIKDRDLIGGNTNIIRDWFIAGPLTLPAGRDAANAVDFSVTDSSHEARYFDNENGDGTITIQT